MGKQVCVRAGVRSSYYRPVPNPKCRIQRAGRQLRGRGTQAPPAVLSVTPAGPPSSCQKARLSPKAPGQLILAPNCDLEGRAGVSGSVRFPALGGGHKGAGLRFAMEKNPSRGPEATSTPLSVPTEGQASPNLSPNVLPPRLHPHRAGPSSGPWGTQPRVLPHMLQGAHPPPSAGSGTLQASGDPSGCAPGCLIRTPVEFRWSLPVWGYLGPAGGREEPSAGPAAAHSPLVPCGSTLRPAYVWGHTPCLGSAGAFQKAPPCQACRQSPPSTPLRQSPRKAEPTGPVTGGGPSGSC